MPNYVRHRGNQGANVPNTGRGPSPYLWGDCPWIEMESDPNLGVKFFDDFVDFGLPGTQTTQINLGRYKVYNTGAGVIETKNGFPSTEISGGVIAMLCDTAGDQSVIGTTAIPYLLNNTAGKLWFEARVAVTGIATNNVQLFLGLGENQAMTFGAAQPLADADAAQTTGGLIGFNMTEDGLGVINSSYEDRSATWTNVQAGVGTFAAHTWKKLGMIYDPEDSTSAVKFYVDGVEQTSVISAATLAALTHIDAKGLGFVFAMFADSAGTSTYGYLDWVRIAQLAA
jgi:hypothetical protein